MEILLIIKLATGVLAGSLIIGLLGVMCYNSVSNDIGRYRTKMHSLNFNYELAKREFLNSLPERK